MSKKKRKNKTNTNKKILIINILLFIIFIILSSMITFNYFKNKKIKEEHKRIFENIKKNYNTTVKVRKKSNIYEFKSGKYIKIGTVSKNVVLLLDESKIKNYNDTYYKVKDHDYYVKYDGVNPYGKEYIKDDYPYLNFGKKIITNKNYKIYLEKKVIYTFNKKSEFEILGIKDNLYIINYDGKLVQINKKDVKEEKDSNEVTNTDKISVLYYESVYDENTEKCADESCVKLSFFNENVNKLKELNYKTISYEDYNLWKNKNVKLPNNSVLIIVKNNDKVNANGIIINNFDENIKFNDNNKQSSIDEDIPSRYKLISKTNMNHFTYMLEGKDINYVTYSNNTSSKDKVAVLNYHFFYDANSESCDQIICMDIGKFKEQLKYLKDNGFNTLTIQDFTDWIYGNKELPGKSVLITVDDGGMGTGVHNGNKLIPAIEEYGMNATLFLITYWNGKENYISPNLQLQSHGYDIHITGSCGKEKALCLSYEELTNDLKKSIPLVDDSTSLAYPFYAYNDNFIRSLKDTGFKVAFVGGNTKATRNSDKYLIPRYIMYKNTSLDTFASYVN